MEGSIDTRRRRCLCGELNYEALEHPAHAIEKSGGGSSQAGAGGKPLLGDLGQYRLDRVDVPVGKASDAARHAQVAGGNLGDAIEPGDRRLVKPSCLPFTYGIAVLKR